MSGFSLLLREKIQDYYYLNMDENFERSIARTKDFLDKITNNKKRFWENNWDRILKSLFKILDFEKIERLYSDDLWNKTSNQDPVFEKFIARFISIFADSGRIPRSIGNKVYWASYSGFMTNQEYQELVDIFGKRLLACYRGSYDSCRKTFFFIDFKVSSSPASDIQKIERRLRRLSVLKRYPIATPSKLLFSSSSYSSYGKYISSSYGKISDYYE